MKFNELPISKQLLGALTENGFETLTPIQEQSFSVVLSGKNIVGIAQTGTGKTFAYLLPILHQFKYSNQTSPRVLIIVPTRELVVQVVEQTELLTQNLSVRTIGVYGGTNIKSDKPKLAEGCDVLIATPGRLYDLVLSRAVQLKTLKKLVIDEVDVMLDLGFRYQINNLFELMPDKRQNIMYSATMTDEIETLIDDFFIAPEKISIAVSGTPLKNINQTSYPVHNFYTKINLLGHLLEDKETFSKVLVFVSTKKNADLLHSKLEESYGSEMGVVHSNKSQNYRLRSIDKFESGEYRVLIATDVMARGLDFDKISHVINIDTPSFPENYMHRIGRTGRAKEKGKTILFYTEAEKDAKDAIEKLMNLKIADLEFPKEVAINEQKIPEERNSNYKESHHDRNRKRKEKGDAFHEKKAKNQKVNLGGKYKREIVKKYKKPRTKGDIIQNRIKAKQKKK